MATVSWKVGHDLDLRPAVATRERVGMKDLRNEARPTRGRAALLGGLLFNLALSRLLRGAISADSIGIVAVEERAMFPRVRDVVRHSRQPFQRVHRFEVPSESRIVLPLVDDRLLAVEVDEPLKGQGVSRHISGQVLEGVRIIRRYRLSDVR
jgi:hypothetical protein